MAQLHVQLLLLLQRRIEDRKAELEVKVGKGLLRDDYQRHVGRIAECQHLLEQVEALAKGSVDELEDEVEEQEQRADQNRTRVKRRAKRNQQGG